MKTLITFYSRTGTTKKVGDMIAQKIGADVEEIKDTVNRKGAMGYIRSGRDAMKKNLTNLEPFGRNTAEYDLVVIGTPIWGWNVSAPVRTFLTEQKDNLKKVAFFCTMGGSGDKQAFAEMEKIIGQKPEATLALRTVDVVKDNTSEALAKFLEELSRA
ncbi:MAG: flavodoxin [Parcubacteria group bacterium]|jgi:flavodoxin